MDFGIINLDLIDYPGNVLGRALLPV